MIITINREYAAQGRTLAAALSERLGIPYYDRDFVLKTAQESGYEAEEVEREGEEIGRAGRIMNDLFSNVVSYKSSYDEIFRAQKKVILELAQDPCIIVGRCADHILREAGREDLITVFLHASIRSRLARAAQLAENGDMELEKYIEKRDLSRKNYYKEYTGQEIDRAQNYTVCFDMGKVQIPVCVDLIEAMVKQG